MLKRLIALPALALVGAMSIPAKAQDAATVVATVNGVEITVGHMIVAYATLPQQYQQLPDSVLFQGILDQLVQQEVLRQSFNGELPPRVPLSLENETRSLTAGDAVEAILQDALTDEAIQAEYDAQYEGSEGATEYNASHILVASEEEALAVVEELNGGADFAAVAREKSTGPSGPNGGSLGWFGAGTMVAPFEAAVVAMEAGAVSAPVETQFGWHVIKLNETRQLDVPKLEDVRAEIENTVRTNALTSAIDALVEEAQVDRPDIATINPAIVRDFTQVQ